jgi:hypothetical protein
VVDCVLVSFTGPGSGTDELTWGQRSVWQSTVAYGSQRTVAGVDALPPGTTIADAAETLRFVMSRHQSLRTRLRFGRADELPRQVCSASGRIALEVVEAGDKDPAAVARAVRHRYQSTAFDYEHDWPVRMAVVCRDGIPSHAVAVYLHLMIDANGLRALIADLRHLAPGWEAAAPPVTAMQPLEQAEHQRTAAVRRQQAASLRHLRRVLSAAPARRFPARPPGSGFHHLRLRSPAALLAARTVAARNGVGTSAVLLAGFVVSLAGFTSVDRVFVMLMVGNRFRPRLADSVSGLTQSSPCLVDVAGLTFDEVTARTAGAAMAAYKHAYYDPYLRDDTMAAINRERGETVDFSCYFNDRRPAETEPVAPVPAHRVENALSRSVLRWEDEVGMPHQKLFVGAEDRDSAIELTASADGRFLTGEDVVTIVRGIESAVVGAALAIDRR